jgi:alpha-amylase/alpha-mannosidase (GH57 family)
MDRYLCIHGHFYQPPRENPWLEAIELQDSAYPYHDWNQRITAECYAPNGASRILDADDRIRQIVNNYSKISFNVGPTLLAWMEQECPDVYGAILAADEESQRRFSGHGSAMAQAYNHMILPLANARDQRTQVLWGIRDFEHRFRRKPEGLWLPETAVDLETLDILAEMGIRFTVLSPYQASKVRLIGGRAWKDVSGGRIDPSMAYRISLPSHRALALFFYDGPIAKAVAFEDLLMRGENLAQRLCEAFSDARTCPQLVHIATDGETYGHHRRHADMALAYALHHIEANKLARLTNYSEFLDRHPPTQEVRTIENSSWSCVHGVERWKADCGCNSGSHSGWNQNWRAPLRQALDWLRDKLAERFEEAGCEVFRDPWQARDAYIDVILDRSPENVSRFLETYANRRLQPAERVRALKLLELQRHAMLMYTSCGWFFDDVSGIETVQVIQYAGRALQLGQDLFGNGHERGFLPLLERAKSNLPEHRDGRSIYEKFVKPAMVNLEKVGAHYAISSLFEEYPPKSRIYSYEVDREDFQVVQEGKTRLALGRAKITSRITGESTTLSFGALHLGDQNVSGGVREYRGAEAYSSLVAEVREIVHRGEIPELVRAVDRNFGTGTYSLRLLFQDEQRKIVGLILDKALAEAASLYRNFYSQYSTLARFITDLGIPLPARFQMAIDFTLHEDLLAALSVDERDASQVQAILEQVSRTGILLDNVTLEFALRKTIERAAEAFGRHPDQRPLLERFDKVANLGPLLPFQVNLWAAQNAYHKARETRFEPVQAWANGGDSEAREWVLTMNALGTKLGFYIAPQTTEATK